jgi:hypothetical protein
MRRVYLFGNGLSLAFNNECYSLLSITGGVRDRLAGMITIDGEQLLDRLNRIGEALRPTSRHPGRVSRRSPVRSTASPTRSRSSAR